MQNSHPLPQNSILPHSPRSPLKRINYAQALLDGLVVIGVGLFISSAAVAVTIGVFIALFVRL